MRYEPRWHDDYRLDKEVRQFLGTDGLLVLWVCRTQNHLEVFFRQFSDCDEISVFLQKYKIYMEDQERIRRQTIMSERGINVKVGDPWEPWQQEQ